MRLSTSLDELLYQPSPAVEDRQDFVRTCREIHPLPPGGGQRPPKPALGEPDPDGFRAFAALGNVDQHALAFIEGGDTGSLEHGGVHESVLPAFVANDEAKALLGIEPLHRA